MPLSQEQLAARRTRIGGSDAAAICGKDPYKTAHEIALRIRGEIEPDASLEDADQILFGNEMEGVLARIYEKKHKVELYTPETLVHPKYPFLAVNIDRRPKGIEHLALEMKNTGLYVTDTWGKPGTDEAPERVILQCAHAMMIDPAIRLFHVLRCYGGNQFQQFVVPRSADLIGALEVIEVEFWNNLERGIIPEPDWEHRSTSEALRRAFKKIQGTVEARPDLVHWTKCWEEAEAARKQAEALSSALKNRIEYLMGNTEVAILPDGRKWIRELINNSGYTVSPYTYIQCRIMKPRPKKGAVANVE